MQLPVRLSAASASGTSAFRLITTSISRPPSYDSIIHRFRESCRIERVLTGSARVDEDPLEAPSAFTRPLRGPSPNASCRSSSLLFATVEKLFYALGSPEILNCLLSGLIHSSYHSTKVFYPLALRGCHHPTSLPYHQSSPPPHLGSPSFEPRFPPVLHVDGFPGRPRSTKPSYPTTPQPSRCRSRTRKAPWAHA